MLVSVSMAALNPDLLLKLFDTRMPFGKYKGTRLVDLPESYVIWFSNEGFPDGELGKMLRTVYEIKVNGLEDLFQPLRQGVSVVSSESVSSPYRSFSTRGSASRERTRCAREGRTGAPRTRAAGSCDLPALQWHRAP